MPTTPTTEPTRRSERDEVNAFAYRLLYDPWPSGRSTPDGERRAGVFGGRKRFKSIPHDLIRHVFGETSTSVDAIIGLLCDSGYWRESKVREWTAGRWQLDDGTILCVRVETPEQYELELAKGPGGLEDKSPDGKPRYTRPKLPHLHIHVDVLRDGVRGQGGFTFYPTMKWERSSYELTPAGLAAAERWLHGTNGDANGDDGGGELVQPSGNATERTADPRPRDEPDELDGKGSGGGAPARFTYADALAARWAFLHGKGSGRGGELVQPSGNATERTADPRPSSEPDELDGKGSGGGGELVQPSGNATERTADPKPSSEPDELDGNAPSYTVADMRDMPGFHANDTLNKYAKHAHVRTPKRGERTFRYSLADARAILKTIMAESGEAEVRKKCKFALENLPEISK